MKLKKYDVSRLGENPHPHFVEVMEGSVPLIYETGDWKSHRKDWEPGCGVFYVIEESGNSHYFFLEDLFSYIHGVSPEVEYLLFNAGQDMIPFEGEICIGKDVFRNFKFCGYEV